MASLLLTIKNVTIPNNQITMDVHLEHRIKSITMKKLSHKSRQDFVNSPHSPDQTWRTGGRGQEQKSGIEEGTWSFPSCFQKDICFKRNNFISSTSSAWSADSRLNPTRCCRWLGRFECWAAAPGWWLQHIRPSALAAAGELFVPPLPRSAWTNQVGWRLSLRHQSSALCRGEKAHSGASNTHTAFPAEELTVEEGHVEDQLTLTWRNTRSRVQELGYPLIRPERQHFSFSSTKLQVVLNA